MFVEGTCWREKALDEEEDSTLTASGLLLISSNYARTKANCFISFFYATKVT